MPPKIVKTVIEETAKNPAKANEAQPPVKVELAPCVNEILGVKFLTYSPYTDLVFDIYHYQPFNMFTLVCTYNGDVLAVAPGLNRDKLLTGTVITEIFLRLAHKFEGPELDKIAVKLADLLINAATWLCFNPSIYFHFNTNILHAVTDDGKKYPILINDGAQQPSFSSQNSRVKFSPDLVEVYGQRAAARYYETHLRFFDYLHGKLGKPALQPNHAFTSSTSIA
ncbi:TPA: hypothetical protein ORQ81_000188 [Escherichia coli]|nr:hypothetical protein [Escherichia coli]